MERLNDSVKFPLGSALPSFDLPNVDGSRISESNFDNAKLVLIAFGCNHCPYVMGSEATLIQLVKKYQARGLMAAMINSNDAKQYPEDSFAAMQAKAKQLQLPYYYLHDESQEVARTFDAVCTPEIYLFDQNKRLIYHGAINNSHRDASKVSENLLEDAIHQAILGQPIARPYTGSIGCSIKWKSR